MDWKTFITLNGGSSCTRNYRNYSASMSKTAFNICGFIQPAFVEKMLLSDDAMALTTCNFSAFLHKGTYCSVTSKFPLQLTFLHSIKCMSTFSWYTLHQEVTCFAVMPLNNFGVAMTILYEGRVDSQMRRCRAFCQRQRGVLPGLAKRC